MPDQYQVLRELALASSYARLMLKEALPLLRNS